MPDDESSDKLPHNGESSSQGGGVNIDGKTNIGGSAVGRDSISNVSTSHTSATTINEGGPVTVYAVLGVIGIAALAMVIIALGAFGRRPPPTARPTPSATASFTPSFTPSATATPSATPLPPTGTPSSTASPAPTDTPTVTMSPVPTLTPTLAPSATATSATTTATVAPAGAATPTLTPLPTSALPLYDNFAGTCLRAVRWMLDWQNADPTPTPGAPVCLDTRPQYMAVDDGLGVFLGQDDTAAKARGETHTLTSAGFGIYRQIEVTVILNKAEVLTDTHTAYLSVAVPAIRANEADMEIRVQGAQVDGKPVYQVTSLLTLRDGSGIIVGQTFPYTSGQTLVIAFRVKGNKLTGFVNDQPIIGPYSILTEPSSIRLGYHADQQTLLDGLFAEVRIMQLAASEIQLPPPPLPAPTLTPP